MTLCLNGRQPAKDFKILMIFSVSVVGTESLSTNTLLVKETGQSLQNTEWPSVKKCSILVSKSIHVSQIKLLSICFDVLSVSDELGR